jgi:hypothetical protein
VESAEKALAEINEQIGLILAHSPKLDSVNKIFTWEEAVHQKLIP